MSDRERSPSGAPPVAIEIPLLDADGHPVDAPRPAGPERPTTDWRRVVGVASVAGLALGIGVAVIMITAADGDPDADDSAPPTTLTPDELETAITTPPTLPQPGAADISEMDGISSQDRELFDPVPSISAPRYPNIDLPEELLVSFDLGRAVGFLATDPPRRSTTRYEVGEEAYRIDVTIDREPARNRYDITIEGDGDDARLIVDLLGGVTYIATEDDPDWVVTDNDEFSGGDAELATVLGRLQRGPVRDSTVRDAVLVTPGPAVTISDTAPFARRFAVTLRAGQVPEWARYQLGAVADAPPPDPSDPILFYAYVSADDDVAQIAEVSGTFPFGNTEQLVVHRIEPLPDDFTIELPDVGPSGPPATEATATPSGSTTPTSTP